MGTVGVEFFERRYRIVDDADGGSDMEITGEFSRLVEWEPDDGPLIDWVVDQVVKAGCWEYTGGEWFADPDGGHTVDYATGEEESVDAFPRGLSPALFADVCHRVRFTVADRFGYRSAV